MKFKQVLFITFELLQNMSLSDGKGQPETCAAAMHYFSIFVDS